MIRTFYGAEEQFHRSVTTAHSGKVEGRAAFAVTRLRVGTGFAEPGEEVHIATGGEHQRRRSG